MDNGSESEGAGEPQGMDPRLRLAIYGVAATAGIFAVVGAAVWSLRIGGSVAVGGAIAVSNLWVLSRIVRAFTSRASSGKAWALIAVLKLVLLFGIVWALITRALLDPIALMAGFGALPIGIAIGSLVGDRSAKNTPDH